MFVEGKKGVRGSENDQRSAVHEGRYSVLGSVGHLMKKGTTSRNHNRVGQTTTLRTFSLTWPWNNYTKWLEEESIRVQRAREETLHQGREKTQSGFLFLKPRASLSCFSLTESSFLIQKKLNLSMLFFILWFFENKHLHTDTYIKIKKTLF